MRLMFLFCLVLLNLTLQPNQGCAAEHSETVLFEEATDGFKLYRIPGIVVTSNGTILAYCEARKFTEADRGEIEIHLRRSTDAGQTWSKAVQVAHHGPRLPRNPHMPEKKKSKDMGGPAEQTVNNPVAIACRDGTVHLLYCVEYMRCFSIRSLDNGQTWSTPVEITAAFDTLRDRCQWQVIATGPGHGVQLPSGRLLAPFWMTDYEKRTPMHHAAGVVYSDDSGQTWKTGDIAIPAGGESNLVELSDAPPIGAAENAKPNVLMIVLDDLNDWVGCLGGHPHVQTPNIDRLAQRGLLFTNAHVPAPVCNPCRASVLTGRSPGSTGIYANDVVWHEAFPGITSLPSHFKANGYHVAGGGKVFHHTPGFNADFRGA